MYKTVNLSKSQIETIVLEALQAGATALGEKINLDCVAKDVNSVIKSEGEDLIQSISASAMKRYCKK